MSKKIVGLRSQWNQTQMNNWHPWQLKKLKSVLRKNFKTQLGLYFLHKSYHSEYCAFRKERLLTFKIWLHVQFETYYKAGKNEKCKDFANHIAAMLCFSKLNILKTRSIILYVKRKAVL